MKKTLKHTRIRLKRKKIKKKMESLVHWSFDPRVIVVVLHITSMQAHLSLPHIPPSHLHVGPHMLDDILFQRTHAARLLVRRSRNHSLNVACAACTTPPTPPRLPTTLPLPARKHMASSFFPGH
jgi:hypothetical protein